MQIPQELKPFKNPTLIAVTDSTQAKLYLAQDRTVEHLDTITSNYPPKADVERTSGEAPSGVRFSEESENISTVSREKLYAALSDDLLKRLQADEFEELVFSAPQEHLAELKESMHIKLLKLANIWVPKLLTNQDIKDILIHIEETDFPEA